MALSETRGGSASDEPVAHSLPMSVLRLLNQREATPETGSREYEEPPSGLSSIPTPWTGSEHGPAKQDDSVNSEAKASPHLAEEPAVWESAFAGKAQTDRQEKQESHKEDNAVPLTRLKHFRFLASWLRSVCVQKVAWHLRLQRSTRYCVWRRVSLQSLAFGLPLDPTGLGPRQPGRRLAAVPGSRPCPDEGRQRSGLHRSPSPTSGGTPCGRPPSSVRTTTRLSVSFSNAMSTPHECTRSMRVQSCTAPALSVRLNRAT